MTIDISKIKVGDKVTIEVTVERSLDRDNEFEVSGLRERPLAFSYVGASRILSHTPAPPRPLEVGDKIRNNQVFNCESNRGKLEAIITVNGQDYAVVSGFTEVPGISLLKNYERAE